jgi:hypothetical protein
MARATVALTPDRDRYTGLVSHHRVTYFDVRRYDMSYILEVDHEDGQCTSSKPRLL